MEPAEEMSNLGHQDRHIEPQEDIKRLIDEQNQTTINFVEQERILEPKDFKSLWEALQS